MPPRSSRGRGGQDALSPEAAAAGAGPSASGRAAAPCSAAAALDALADAAPSLLRLPAPSGAPAAPLSISALRRLVEQLRRGSEAIAQRSSEQDGGAAVALLRPRLSVTAALLFHQPLMWVPPPVDEGHQRWELEAAALREGRVLVVDALHTAVDELLHRAGEASNDGGHVGRDAYRRLLRAGVLSFAARNMAAAAAAVEATAPDSAVPREVALEAYCGGSIVFTAARAALVWPALAPEVEAAFEGSQVLQHAGRLHVLLLARVAGRVLSVAAGFLLVMSKSLADVGARRGLAGGWQAVGRRLAGGAQPEPLDCLFGGQTPRRASRRAMEGRAPDETARARLATRELLLLGPSCDGAAPGAPCEGVISKPARSTFVWLASLLKDVPKHRSACEPGH
jgi:hypothetical protein